MKGELERSGDRWALRFTRRLPHPPAKVWRAVTESDHLAAWFPQRIVGAWEVGTPLRFEDPSGRVPGFEGEVLAVQPERLLEFRWGTDTLALEIDPDGLGSVLTLRHTFAEQGKGARDAAGWHLCLDLLVHRLDGRAPGWTNRDRWNQVHGDYVAKFGPEASTIGPPRS